MWQLEVEASQVAKANSAPGMYGTWHSPFTRSPFEEIMKLNLEPASCTSPPCVHPKVLAGMGLDWNMAKHAKAVAAQTKRDLDLESLPPTVQSKWLQAYAETAAQQVISHFAITMVTMALDPPAAAVVGRAPRETTNVSYTVVNTSVDVNKRRRSGASGGTAPVSVLDVVQVSPSTKGSARSESSDKKSVSWPLSWPVGLRAEYGEPMAYEVPSFETYATQTLQKNLAYDLEQIRSLTLQDNGDVIITLDVRKPKTTKVSIEVAVSELLSPCKIAGWQRVVLMLMEFVAQCAGRTPGLHTWDESVATKAGFGIDASQRPDPVASNFPFKMGYDTKGLLILVQKVMGGAFEEVMRDEWSVMAPFFWNGK